MSNHFWKDPGEENHEEEPIFWIIVTMICLVCIFIVYYISWIRNDFRKYRTKARYKRGNQFNLDEIPIASV